MYLWRRLASRNWWSDNEDQLRAVAGHKLAIIDRPNWKRLELEVACHRRRQADNLLKEFRGRVKELPRNWLKYFAPKTKRIEIRNQKLIIPAGAAFGTGEHATTAMSLRLLEKLTRRWKRGWSIVDLGTGSGILALAAKRCGATRIIGIDNDPIAISTAKQNARLNKIDGVQLRIADIRCFKFPLKVDIVAANLFSELLIEILPMLKKSARWLILSGILRRQERDVTRALKRNTIDILEARRRGKWVAILAQKRVDAR
jgi:ribosomal protein L11 methyltransferase